LKDYGAFRIVWLFVRQRSPNLKVPANLGMNLGRTRPCATMTPGEAQNDHNNNNNNNTDTVELSWATLSGASKPTGEQSCIQKAWDGLASTNQVTRILSVTRTGQGS